MPVSTEIMALAAQALTAFQDGDDARGFAALEEHVFAFAPQLTAANPFEVAMVLAGVGKVLEAAGQFELAALKYADAATYAEIREPGTVETAGDFADLADMLERVGDRAGALHAVQRSAEHLKLAGIWEARQAAYEERMARLRADSEGTS
ncbi:MAG: hypothetical protein JMN25_00780 [gamma proteobacterium endosymbiont of Lamellibrachia anaximandri]|nr:hypothetical protein [gamma proteobacterium endosymbiont of Lamellibrachia anaximandri]